MSQEIKKRDRVLICRKIIQPGVGVRYIKMVEDGVVLDRRVGFKGDWIRVLAPCSLDGHKINQNPDTSEWFPLVSAYIRVIKTNAEPL